MTVLLNPRNRTGTAAYSSTAAQRAEDQEARPLNPAAEPTCSPFIVDSAESRSVSLPKRTKPYPLLLFVRGSKITCSAKGWSAVVLAGSMHGMLKQKAVPGTGFCLVQS